MTRQRPRSAAPVAQTPHLDAPNLDAPNLDAHGFDPNDFDWLPVTRKPRADGWSPTRQRAFIAELAATGSVQRACMRVDMSPSSAHRLRRSPGAEQFSAAWDVALEHAARVLLDTAFERAFEGSSEPVFDREGNRVGIRHRQNDRLLMFLLRAYMPERFRHAHRDWRTADEPLPPAPQPLALALERMTPVAPDDPQALMTPEDLEDALECAEVLDGKLPHWREGPVDAGALPPENAEFEALIAEMKRAAAQRDSG